MKSKFLILISLLIVLVAGPLLPARADVLGSITGNVLTTPGTTDAISAYSLKKGCMEIGAGYGFLNIAQKFDVDIATLGTQQNATLALNIGAPLQSLQNSVLKLVWPGLDKVDGGAFCGWGYSYKTDDNGNTFFAWSGIDYGISLTLKY